MTGNTETVDAFLAALSDRDISAAVATGPDAVATFHALRVSGTLAAEGAALLGTLVEAFPDLVVERRRTITGGRGQVLVELTLRGTQHATFAGVHSRGRALTSRQAWRFEVGPDGRLAAVTAFWCSNEMRRALGDVTSYETATQG